MQSVGVRSVDLSRGPGGFGFTLSSQGPCVLSCILASSPAHKAGLRPGDQILFVNGSSVEKSPHEQVVKLIARSPNGVVNLGVRNCTDSVSKLPMPSPEGHETSEEEIENDNILNRVDKVVEELKSGSLSINTPSSLRRGGFANVSDQIINEDEIVSDEELKASFSETLRSESSSDSVFLEQSNVDNRRSSEGDGLPGRAGTQTLNRLSYPALTPATPNQSEQSEMPNIEPDLRAVVGYLGSIELPASSCLQTASLNAIRSCVRRLRAQKKVHVMFMLEVSVLGIQLIDGNGKNIVTYPVKSLAFTGVCSDDERVFGIVTRKSSEGNRPNSWHSTNDKMDMANTVNCSCHVFSVDPEIAPHADHVLIAQKFHINCTPSNEDGECEQFLSSSSSILQSINGLFKEKNDSQSTDGMGTLLQSHSSSQSERSDSEALQQERGYQDTILNTHSGQLDNNVQLARNESVINECVMETPNHRIRVRVTDGGEASSEKSGDKQEPFRHRVAPIQKNIPVTLKKGKEKYIINENQNLKMHNITSERDWDGDVFADDNRSHKSDVQDNTSSSAEASPDSHMSTNSRENENGHDGIVKMCNSKFYVNHMTRLSHSAENLAHSEYVPSSPSNLNVSASVCSSTQSIHSLSSMPGDTSGIDGRVARWALGFDKLMEDPIGLKCFEEFLKKEFSEENIVFWMACEDFRNINNEKEQKSTAISIFDAHLSSNATMPVNIDSSAVKLAEEYLANPTNDMYRLQQQQVYTLMKFDSYPRFLKSDLYRKCLVSEMEGSPLPFDDGKPDKGKLLKKRSTRGWGRRSSKKSTSSYDENRTPGEKKKSFLPWKGKQAKKGANRPFDSQPSSARSSLSSLSDSFPNMSYSTESLEGRRESEVFQFCRIVLPDHSSTIVTGKQGQTLRQTLMQLCERRHMSFVSTDVFIGGADKPASLKEVDVDIQSMAGKEVILEHRSLFRLEMSPGNFLIVKSKPDESLRMCLEPILNRNGLNYSSVSVHLVDCEVPLDSGVPIASIEHQWVVVDKIDPLSGNNNGPPKINIKPPVGFSSPRRGSRRGSSWDDTIFDDIMRGKKQSLGDGYFDDANVWVPGLKPFRSHESLNDDSFGRSFLRGPGLFSRKRKESNDKERSSVKAGKPTSKSNTEVTELLDLLSRAQGKRMDDQRGALGKENFELPDFLRIPVINREINQEIIDENDSSPPPPPPPPPPPVGEVRSHQKTESLKLRKEERPVIRKTLSTPAGMQGPVDLMEELAEKLRRRSMSEAASIPENHQAENDEEGSPTRSQSYSPWERQEHHRRINVVRPRAVTDGAVFKVEAVTPVRLDGTTSLSHVRQQKLRVTHSESMPDTLPTRTSNTQPITVNTKRGLHTSTGNIKGRIDEHIHHDKNAVKVTQGVPVQKYHTYSSKQRTVSLSSAPDHPSNVPYVLEASPVTGKRSSRVRHVSDTDAGSKGNISSPFRFPQANAKKAEVYIPSSAAICAKPYRVVSSGSDTKPRPKPITVSQELMAGLEDDKNSKADNESIPEQVTSTPSTEGLKVLSSVERLQSPVQGTDRTTNSPLPLPPSPLPEQMDELDVADFPPPTPLCEFESSTVTPSPDQSMNKTITPSTNDRTFVAEPTNQGTPLAAPKVFRDNVLQKRNSRLLEDSLDSSRKPGKEIPKLDPYVTYETEDLRITFV